MWAVIKKEFKSYLLYLKNLKIKNDEFGTKLFHLNKNGIDHSEELSGWRQEDFGQ